MTAVRALVACVVGLSGCRSFAYEGTMGPLPLCAVASGSLTGYVAPVSASQCFARVRFDALADRRQRVAVEEAVGTLCGMFSDPAFERAVEARSLWLTGPDGRCVTQTGAQFWAEFRRSWTQPIKFELDDSQTPAATSLAATSATLKLSGRRIGDWNIAVPRSPDNIVSRARLINTLAHELVHVKPDAPNSSVSFYQDTGGPQNDYLRSLLASYQLGDVAECWFIAGHSTNTDETFARCLDVRQNDRTLVPTTRTGYWTRCQTGDATCRAAVEGLSNACRDAAVPRSAVRSL